MNPSANRFTSGPLVPVVALVLAGLVAFTTVSSLHIKHTTGTLTISTPVSTAAISISQNNKEAKMVGTGSTKLRLLPGSYEIASYSNGNSVTGRATVRLGKNTVLRLPKTQAPPVPSSDNITFTGMDTVVARGLTTDQAANIRELFFKYKKNAKYIAILPSTVTPGPHNPDSNDPFTLNFSGTIDSVPYKATLTYSDLENVQLTIFDPQTGATLFNMSSDQ